MKCRPKYYVVDVHDGKGYYLARIPKRELRLEYGPYKTYDTAVEAVKMLNKPVRR